MGARLAAERLPRLIIRATEDWCLVAVVVNGFVNETRRDGEMV
jgi:hypothetical protein